MHVPALDTANRAGLSETCKGEVIVSSSSSCLAFLGALHTESQLLALYGLL